jgi:hypothetical protein
LNHLVSRLGAWFGFVLVLVGLLWLAYSLLARLAGNFVAMLPIQLPPNAVPIWGGIIPLVLGIVCCVWGWGMMRYRSWAPFVAAHFLLNLALYLGMLVYLVSEQIIPVPSWAVAEWDIYRTLLSAAAAAIILLFVLFAGLILFGPGGLTTAYVARYQILPPPRYVICRKCRSIISRPDGSCSWCEPRNAQAELAPLGGQPGETLVLTLSREQNRVVIGRRTPERPAVQPGFVYLDPRVRNEYGTISAIHAALEYSYADARFAIEDQQSTHGTRVIQGQTAVEVAPFAKQPLLDGDIVELGGARFAFKVVSTGA